MQRKKLGRGHPDFAKEVEKMPFQMKYDNLPKEGFAPAGMLPNSLAAAHSAFPLFGGTSTETEESPPKEEASTTTEPTDEAPGGDSSPIDTTDMNPEQIAELLKQVTDLTTQVTKLSNENNTYKSKEQQAERNKQTREQQLEQDIVEAQQTIAKMDAVIRHTAVINAIQGMKDMEFHSARHVMNELSMDSFDLDVDLDSGTATVTGIEGELKRVAKECPWLVSKDKTHRPAGEPPQRNVRGSGAPPTASGAAGDKQTKRSDLINKYPVIAHGRSG